MKTSQDVLETSRRIANALSVAITAAPDPKFDDVQRSGAAQLTSDQVMTASEVATLLHMPVSTVYYLANRGELPAKRLGRSWRFLRSRLDELLWS